MDEKIDLFKFKKNSYKAVMFSKALNRFFVSEPMESDSGLACLFGFENNGLKRLDDLVLCSQKFIDEIKEEWWKLDWCHIGNIQSTITEDRNQKEIFEGDVLQTDIGTGYVLYYGSTYCIKFTDGVYLESCKSDIQTILPLDYVKDSVSNELQIISSIYYEHNKRSADNAEQKI